MVLWQHLAGRFLATVGRRSLRQWNVLAKPALPEGSPQLVFPLLGQWNRAATNLSLFGRDDHQRTYAYLLPVPVLFFGAGGVVAKTEELSNNSPSSAASSSLSEVPVHLSEDTLTESQPGEAPSNAHTAKWRIYTDMGRDLFSKGRLDEAEKYFLQALEEAKQGFGDKDSHVASSCNNLAELYRMKKDYARAEPLFLEAVRRLEIAFSDDHESVGFAIHNLAGNYLMQRKFDEARKCYERSLKIKEKKLGQNHPEYANTLFHLGEGREVIARIRKKNILSRRCRQCWFHVLRLQGNYKDAQELIRDSLRILEEGGVGHSQTAVRRMGRLVEILTHTGQMQEAENLQRKILHVLELSQGMEATSTTMAAENLAGTLQAVGKVKEAKELLERCFQVRKITLPPNHIQLGVTMFKLASVIIQYGDDLASKKGGHNLTDAKLVYEIAEELLRRAIRIAERCWKDSSAARSPIPLRAGPLISLLRSLDAFGHLKIRKLELATSAEEKEEGIKEAEESFLQCLRILERSDFPQAVASIPEVQRQHIACLRHLAGLLSSVSYLKNNSTTKEQIDQLLSRSENIAAKLRDSVKTLKK